MNKVITLSPAKIRYILLALIALLLLANLAIVYLRFVVGYEHLRGFVYGFYFDMEANFPSLYSAMAIFVCAVLLWMIGSLTQEKAARRSAYWKLLAVVFAFLACDEFGSLHEYMITPMRRLVRDSPFASDYLYFAWFIPYLVLVVVLAALLFRFLLKLPGRTRVLFIGGGFVFLVGAVGMEIVGGKYWASQHWAIDGTDDVDLRYALIVTFEELLEMLGMLIFMEALIRYYLNVSGSHSLLLKIGPAD